MADKTNDIWNDNDGEEEAPAKRGRLRRFLLFALVLLAVLGGGGRRRLAGRDRL